MDTAYQLALQRIDVGKRAIVGLAGRLRPHIGGRNDVQLVLQVIERQQPVIKRKYAVRQVNVDLRGLRQALELAHHVVGEVAHASGGKRRQSWHVCRAVLPQPLPQQPR